MGPLAARVEGLALRAKRGVKRFMLCQFTLFVFANVGVYCTLVHLWPTYGLETHCEHPPLPANQSGVKVLVAAFAKMGTRTMSRSLHQLGLERSYHSEELALHVWSRVASEHWALPENAGVLVPLGMPYVGRGDSDLQVLRSTSPEALAAALSRCRADAVAFDGLEELFWPVYEVSPGAKVLVLNWRTAEEVRESQLGFNPWFAHFMYISVYLSSALQALPWGLLLHLLDPLLGWPVRSLLRGGAPPVNQEQGPLVMLWYRLVAPYRVGRHWFQGLSSKGDPSFFGMLVDEEAQAAFFARVAREVPPERRLDFDPRRQDFGELCAFLGLADCPRSGPLPKARSVYSHERDFPLSFCFCVAVYLLLHWVNWKIFGLLLGALLASARRAKTD